ncbi:hypothetical protein P9Z80_30285 [Bacillus cereus]|nr:hypothetical protein [Bacillus cereus]MEC3259297.1 hypothetical protein [Bacillus cereus]
MKTIKRDLYAKKPQGDGQVLFPREPTLLSLTKRCQALEENFEYEEPIYKVLPVLPSGEIVYEETYYECRMRNKVVCQEKWYESTRKRISMLSPDGEVLREFDSVRDAATYLVGNGDTKSLSIAGTSYSLTTRARKGKTYLGYLWRYEGGESL